MMFCVYRLTSVSLTHHKPANAHNGPTNDMTTDVCHIKCRYFNSYRHSRLQKQKEKQFSMKAILLRCTPPLLEI